MPQPAFAVLEVDADVDTLRAALHWGDADFAPTASGGCRVRIEGSSDDALLRVVTWLAGRHPVTVVEPPSVATLVTDLVARLTASISVLAPSTRYTGVQRRQNEAGSVREGAAVGEDGVGQAELVVLGDHDRRRVRRRTPGTRGRAAP